MNNSHLPDGWFPFSEPPAHSNPVVVALGPKDVGYVIAQYFGPYWYWDHPFGFPDNLAIAWREIPNPFPIDPDS